MMGKRRENLADVSGGMDNTRANYEAARSGRFRRRRDGLLASGSSADYHYRNVFDYLRIMEYARDMDRNDPIIGTSIDRATNNTIQGGMTVDPDTGDKALDTDLKGRFEDWADDKQKCDVSCQHNFNEFEEFADRHATVDGDCFVSLLDEGSMQFIEGHRVRTPSKRVVNGVGDGPRASGDNYVIAGVLVDERRRPLQYWVTKDDVDPFSPVPLVSDVEKIDTLDAQGNPQILHVWRGKRKSQTRGMSVLAPVFDFVGMHEDIQFAKLVQQQIASCFAIIRERETNWKPNGVDPYGPDGLASDLATIQKKICEEIAPGFEARGLPGEKISGFSPNIPNAEFFQQMRMILQIVFINLGLPLVMGLMDASDTNFSGWRGAVDEARRGFKRKQTWLIERFHTPVYQWKLRQFVRADASLRRQMTQIGSRFYQHRWNTPRWAYIQPLQDANADTVRRNGLLSSPRRINLEHGDEHREIIVETVDDNGNAISLAGKKAKELSTELGEKVSWRDVLFMADANMMAASVKAGAMSNAAAPKAQPVQPTAEQKTQDFMQKLVLVLAGNPLTAPVIANAMTIAGKSGIVAGAGAPADPEAADPYLPVLVPAGQMQVTGGIVKDADGGIVGGAAAASVESTGGAAVAKPEEKPGDATQKTDGDGNQPPAPGEPAGTPPAGGAPSESTPDGATNIPNDQEDGQ